MKNNKGITLIALIVTIIVLIILAGVAIAMLRGDNGILNRASEAKYDNVIGSTDEQVRLAQMALRTSITAEMVNAGENGYIATGATEFGKLVEEVMKDLGVKTVNTKTTEGFAVYQYLDTGSDSKDGTGYILITYTDNALRSSLPAEKVETSPFTINGVKFTKAVDSSSSFSVNKATIAYVIKVSNYNCELSDAIMTETVTVEKAAEKKATSLSATSLSATDFDNTAIGGADTFTKNGATN